MNEHLMRLRRRMEELSDANATVRAAAEAEERDLTPEERQAIRENNDTFEELQEEAVELERDMTNAQALRTTNGRRTEPERPQLPVRMSGENRERRPPPARSVVQVDRGRNDLKGGFDNMGDFLIHVKKGTVSPHAMDQRLIIRGDIATDYSSSEPGAEGGFAIPPDFRTVIQDKVFGEQTLLGRTDQMQTSSNQITFPLDENEPWSTAGLQMYWEGEGAVKRTSVVDLDQQTVRANKIAGVVPVTDELLEDAPALESYIRRKVPEKIDWKTSFGIIQGSGTGEPLGILNSAARVTVDPGAAPTGSVQSPHIAEMYSRMPAGSRGNAVWLVNPEVEPHLLSMAFMTAPAATLPTVPIPVYLPANGLSASPYSTLMGRPVIPTQACNALGEEGDIIFVDLKQYMTVTKGGGIRTDVSIHVFFLQDITAFRFVLRIGGRPWWKRPIQPRAGTFTQSPYVTLGDR